MTEVVRGEASLAMAAAKEAVVRRMIDALQRADMVAVGELLSDDVIYHFPGRSAIAGTYRGRGEVLGMFGAFSRLLGGPPQLSSHDVVASEAHVVDLATHAADGDGQPYEWHAVRVYHVAVDRITEIWLMIGDIYAFDAWLESDDREVNLSADTLV